jgi:hypothetical protein
MWGKARDDMFPTFRLYVSDYRTYRRLGMDRRSAAAVVWWMAKIRIRSALLKP